MLDKLAVYFTSTVGMGLAVIAIGLAVAFTVQTVRLSLWEKDYAKLEVKYKDDTGKLALDAAVQKQKAATWQAISATQAAETTKAKKESERLEKELKGLSAEFEKQRQKDAQAIAGILNYKPSGPDCVEAVKQVQDLALERRKP